MKKTILALALLLASIASSAQTGLTRSYTQRPLSEVLADIDKSTTELSISFIYNKLEDYPVTCQLSGEDPYEAILKVIGFYPVKVTRHESIVLVEPVYDTENKLTGHVLDETGAPLEFVNVALYSLADDKLITSGVTTANGDFVIPCEAQRVRLRAFLIGYKTVERECAVEAVGAILMEPSMQYNLNEVVITADAATTSAEKTSYFPSRTERNAALDATSLLQHMMIPQLRINPASGYITTLAGEGVSIFIDYMPATREDLEGMNTQDVKRVEIYDYPSDVRFQNKPHVVNFVMQKYETGGYTKLTSTEAVLADFSANNSVYSKLSHKNWTFDANITSELSNQNHLGSETTETFNLPTQTITRTETFANGKQRDRETSVSLRATYNGKKIQLSNRLEFLDENTPKNEMFGNVNYQPIIFSPSASISRQTSRSITPTYEGDWYFSLPRQWMLNVVPTIQYSHNKQNRFYQEGELQPIDNLVKEDVTQMNWQIGLGKTFAQKHSVYFGNYGVSYNSRMDYTGSTLAHQEMNFIALGVPVKYTYQSQKLNLSAMATALYQRYNVNGVAKSDWAPAFITTGNYAFNPKNMLQATLKIALNAANGSLRNPSVMQKNEILYYNGNPQVDNYNFYLANLQYTWMPSNIFTAAAFVEYIFDKNFYANTWQPYLDGKILQTIDNVGDLHTTKFGASLTLRLLDGNLQFNVNPSLRIYKTSGEYNEKGCPFSCDIDASYYFGDFYLNAGYESPYKTFKYRKIQWWQSRSQYYLTAGWGNAKWKAKIDLVNIGRTDWRNLTTVIQTPLYTQNAQAFNAGAHQRINLTLTYTFGYGKKVKQGNELGTATAGQSSIL